MISTKPIGSIPADIASRFTRPGTGDVTATPPVPKVLQIYPWWLYKPPTGQDIAVLGQNSFLAAGTTELVDTIKQLDQNTMAIVRSLDFYVNDLTPASQASFSLLINGNPAGDYGKINIFPRTAASTSQSFDTFVFVPAGARISISATNSDGGAYLVGAGYQGWSVPVNIDTILGVAGGAYTGAT